LLLSLVLPRGATSSAQPAAPPVATSSAPGAPGPGSDWMANLADAAFPHVVAPLDESRFGDHIQRTMTLLATSTPTHRNRVRILFYGQSITQQNWSREVSDDLIHRFPYADVTILNLAIGGFASQLLKYPAEHQLYPFYPDLVIFHVYGDHHDYESIIRSIRQRTTSEILMQTDHVISDATLNEETDPAKITQSTWDAWMNHVFLPATAAKYGAELADVHDAWKLYLLYNDVHAAQLLRDGVHLNTWGNYVMAHEVEPYLQYRPDYPNTEWKNLVRDYNVGTGLKWHHGHLKLRFVGNKIEAIAAPGPPGNTATARVLIDGRPPSTFPELTVFTLPQRTPNIGWPAITRLASEKPLVPEDWTATLTHINPDATQFQFSVTGSVTGFDGTGSSGSRFVSNSGRVVIDPARWFLNADYNISKKPTPEGWQIHWRAVPLYADTLRALSVADPSRETFSNLAQGLTNGPHTLELILNGKGTIPLQSLRVYTPPLH